MNKQKILWLICSKNKLQDKELEQGLDSINKIINGHSIIKSKM